MNLRAHCRRGALVGAVFSLGLAFVGIAATPSASCACTSFEKRDESSMKWVLRNLVTTQEAFFSDSSRYASSIAELAVQGDLRLDGVELISLSGWRDGFTARVRHPRAPGQECWIDVGTKQDGSANPYDGEPRCDPRPKGAIDPVYFILLTIYAFAFLVALSIRHARGGRGLPAIGMGTYLAFLLLAVLHPFWIPLRVSRSCLDGIPLHVPATIMMVVVAVWMLIRRGPAASP